MMKKNWITKYIVILVLRKFPGNVSSHVNIAHSYGQSELFS